MNEKIKWKDEIFPYLSQDIICELERLPTSVISNISEIRLRAMGAVSVTVGSQNRILYKEKKPLILSATHLNDIFSLICDGAVFKYENQIKNGYITIPGGHRVGFCGTAIYENDKICSVSNITSISFRISREIINSAREIIGDILGEDRIYSSLIVSEPCGGKTTILTDLARLLSNYGKRAAVIDERGEICSVFNGVPQKNVGILTDVYNEYTKGEGMMSALRCLSPQVIICDEIGGSREVDAMLEALNAGVPVIATAHASNEQELMERPQIERLVDHGAIDKIIFLKGNRAPGSVRKVVTVNRYDEDYWDSDTVC